MTISPPTRPESAIQRLIAILEPHGTPMEVIPRKRINWEYKEIPQFYIFKQGEISVLRAADGLVIATVSGQNLFGIAESIQPLRSHILRVETECTMLRLDASLAHEIITQEGMWKDIAVILAYYTTHLFYRDSVVVQQRTYSIIRGHLIEMNRLPEDSRLRTSILDYIQERTHLSRSSILNVMFALKNGGYINIKRGGYLLAVINLPEKF
ncbi:helix-turn-helix domain-containing protein [Buttiauxella sp. A2-C1_F]|uniref:helix-turn-helix domain-containing protein n=1 Tax=unclassified Buttiauxella TaxID=2634062 RepID=UPI001E5F10C1|nr:MULTISPECIES: helix-turn-helix domain-containing protein [unclassified Buttiauxella]MCE0801392.1 helix-turn-helix domain-containing protein [Buttiauxella sp. W03-F01]MCE0813351.1 helix-turn-helix domain-containing protein [Buttiauxella sp. S04-F03]MCE0846657.1 helix-turn-helix domain-containing protein [Buttiauxella sp. A2-C1_F]